MFFLPDSDNVSHGERDVADLGDEDGRHGLVQRRAVHVDGGPNGHDEARHAGVDSILVLKRSNRDWQRC